MKPLLHTRLYYLDLSSDLPSASSSKADITPLDLQRLTDDILPLLATACSSWVGFPPPDVEEAGFLLRWIIDWPLHGWLAEIEESPAGFILLGPDLAPRLQLAKGGRNPIRRAWLQFNSKRPVQHGLVLFGGVLPAWRRQGIGSHLLNTAMRSVSKWGWKSLSIGPIPENSPAVPFLEQFRASPIQSYTIYQREL